MLTSCCPRFSASVRLALRWVSAQMMSDHMPDIATELLMAQVTPDVDFGRSAGKVDEPPIIVFL